VTYRERTTVGNDGSVTDARSFRQGDADVTETNVRFRNGDRRNTTSVTKEGVTDTVENRTRTVNQSLQNVLPPNVSERARAELKLNSNPRNAPTEITETTRSRTEGGKTKTTETSSTYRQQQELSQSERYGELRFNKDLPFASSRDFRAEKADTVREFKQTTRLSKDGLRFTKETVGLS
jgi:hypothetical protein